MFDMESEGFAASKKERVLLRKSLNVKVSTLMGKTQF